MTSKICTICKTNKSLTEFYRLKTVKDGRRSACKTCTAAKQKKFRSNIKDVIAEKMAKWREENPFYGKQWRIENKSLTNAYTAKRRSKKLKATPKWANEKIIQSYYNVCAFFNEVNGYTKYHVDHIIPLQGKLVSGLHVEGNLQIILAKDNFKKSNSFIKADK